MSIWWERMRHVVTGHISDHEHLPDLRHLPSRRIAVERTHYLVNDTERRHQAHRLYVLRREPRSPRDASSIAVYANGRNVGYLPHRIAVGVAPLLDRLGGAVTVNGVGAKHGSSRLRVDVPTVEALTGFADSDSDGDGDGDRGASPVP